jgi:hypothetical protein
VVVVLAAVVGVLALGGGDDDDGDEAAAFDRTTTSAVDTTTTTEPETTTTTEAPTTTTTEPQVEDPAEVIGRSVAEAVGDLLDAGFEVTQQEVIDESVPDGQVTAAQPQPDGSVVLTVARPPVTRFLEGVQPVDRDNVDLHTPTFDVSGTTYSHGVWLESCSSSAFIEYDLGRDFRRFQATVGLLDDVPSDARARVELTLDGTIVSTDDIGLGDTIAVDLDVTQRLRVRVGLTRLQGGSCFRVGLGDGRLLGVPSEVPPETG